MMLRALLVVIVSVVTAFVSLNIYYLINHEQIPDIDEHFWWASENGSKKNDERIYPFTIEVTPQAISDLYQRLNNTRGFTPALENVQCQYGVSAAVMDNITNFLQEQYNVEDRLQFLNSLPQYKTQIQGLNIHFVHIKPKNENNLRVIPILILHGWPSSVGEYYEFASFLSTNQDIPNVVFELIMPSIPGFGYSDAAVKPGFRGPHIAAVFKTLMKRLGHDRFLIHSNDWGAIIGVQLATLYPDSVLGYHSNFCFSLRIITLIKWALGSLYPRLVVEDRHAAKMYPVISGPMRFYLYEAGYMHIMGTKPDTLGHGLDNSPEFAISFLLEKFAVGTARDNVYKEDSGLSALRIDRVMDTILFYYWFPKKSTTAARLYAENLQLGGFMDGLHNVPLKQQVPCGCAVFENEIIYEPESFVRDKLTNLVHFKTYDVGGHFAALENTEMLVNDLILFIKKIVNDL